MSAELAVKVLFRKCYANTALLSGNFRLFFCLL